MAAYNKVRKNKKLLIFGTGFIAEEVYNYFTLDSQYKVIAFIKDKNHIKKKNFLGLKVYPLQNIEKKFSPKEYEVFIAIGYTDLNFLREKKFKEFKKKGFKLASYISSQAAVINPQKDYENCLILENTTIQTTSKIGKNVFIWANNLIGHHAKIGNNCYISGHCTIAGSTVVGKNCFLGANSTIAHNLRIGSECIIGANSLIVSNVFNRSISSVPQSKILKTKNLELLKKLIK